MKGLSILYIFSPFDEAYINDLISTYLQTFALTDDWHLIQSWHGFYPKMTDGTTDVFLKAEEGVYIINGLGGARNDFIFWICRRGSEKSLVKVPFLNFRIGGKPQKK